VVKGLEEVKEIGRGIAAGGVSDLGTV